MKKKFLDRILTRRCHLIVEEEDMIRALNVINKHHRVAPDMRVGNCGWADDTKKWFIHFTTTEYKWNLIRNDLKVVRVFENTDIPKNCIEKVYTTD